ncbi:MAG: nucleotidyl transferase AbiEii/AbiGii toxin family protein [Candidatus Bathyarchaeia archaeon]
MYDRALTEASKGALVELCMVLREYRGEFVLAGGWAPYFLTRGYYDHCGSTDIDLVLRPRVMPKYMSVREIIENLGYEETGNPFRFTRRIPTIDGAREFEIKLDFLTEPEAAMELDLLVDVQEDLRACLIRGVSVVFDFNYEDHVEATLPNDGQASTSVDVADVVGSLATKGLALPRLKDKDSYDIYTVAGFHGGSPIEAARVFKETVRSRGRSNPVISEALANIRGGFASPTRYGCFAVARFIGSDGSIRLDAYERVTAFLESLAFPRA